MGQRTDQQHPKLLNVSLFMLASCKVTGKVIAVPASESTYVTLKRVLVTMASHVDGIEYVVWEIYMAVGAVVECLGILYWGGCSRLTVGTTGSAGSLTTGSNPWATAAVRSRSGLWGDGRRSLG